MAPRQQASRSVWRDRSPTHMHAHAWGERGRMLASVVAGAGSRCQHQRRDTRTGCRSIIITGAAKRHDHAVDTSKQLRIRQGWQKGTADGQTLYHHLAPIVARTQSLASRAAHGPGSYPQFINPPNPSIHQSITSRGPALLERKTRQTLLHPPVSLSVCPFVC
jgi:hypothetical protein